MKHLSSEEIKEIKALYAAGNISQSALADKFGTAQSTIHRVVSGQKRESTRKPKPYKPAKPRPPVKFIHCELLGWQIPKGPCGPGSQHETCRMCRREREQAKKEGKK